VALRKCEVAEVRESCSMSKGPDLSAFPIPRKGGARPLVMDEAAESAHVDEQEASEGPKSSLTPTKPGAVSAAMAPTALAPLQAASQPRPAARYEQQGATPPVSGQTVATTVKLDEGRYLRLADAGKPAPGRLKRRTIQEIMVEALDEWFERRGL